MMRLLTMVGIVALSIITMSACTTAAPGDPDSESVSSTSSTLLPAPQVAAPLNVTKFEQSACDVLTLEQANQVAQLTTTQTSSFPTPLATCSWTDGRYNAISFSFIRGNGLSDVYGTQDSESGYFAVAPDIAGYPAVFAGTHDDRGSGNCQVVVGVRNDMVLSVLSSFVISSPYYKDPCFASVKATEAAVATLKGGS